MAVWIGWPLALSAVCTIENILYCKVAVPPKDEIILLQNLELELGERETDKLNGENNRNDAVLLCARSSGNRLRRRWQAKETTATSTTTTPYTRPQQNQSLCGRFLSKLVDPSYRLIAGGATRIFPSLFSKHLTNDSLPLPEPRTNETVNLDEDREEHPNGEHQTSSTVRDFLHEILVVTRVICCYCLIGYHTFFLNEINRLVGIINSRAVDVPKVDQERKDLVLSARGVKDPIVSHNLGRPTEEKQDGSNKAVWDLPTPLPKPTPSETGRSPIEIAKAYMAVLKPEGPFTVGNSIVSKSAVSSMKNNLEQGGAGSSSVFPSVDSNRRSEVNIPPVCPHSSQMARTIFEHLERNLVTPKEKSEELKIATSSKISQSSDVNANSLPYLGLNSSKRKDQIDNRSPAQGNEHKGNSFSLTEFSNNGGTSIDFWKSSGFSNQDCTQVLASISVSKPEQRWMFASDNSTGFSFPVSASSIASSEPPTPSIMPSLPGSNLHQLKKGLSGPLYSFGGSSRLFPSLIFFVPINVLMLQILSSTSDLISHQGYISVQ
ncbi:hypothetical protein GQ457_07G041100 [Hibiscus cannabinus]